VRQVAKQVSLDAPGVPEPVAAPAPDDPGARERLAQVQHALNDAIHALDPRERLRLRLYYGQGLKLAAIGRMLGEHEATVSRKLERIRTQLRQEVERRLGERHGPRVDPAAWMQEAAETGELDLSHALTADDS
jgi:DNA-directed RNA polymerase specialized sigma24 family protein